MKKPEFEVFHFADIDFRDLPHDLVEFLKNNGSKTYTDTSTHLNEDLYDLQDTAERLEEGEIECSDEVTEQFNELLKWMDELKCSYFRMHYL